MCCSPQTTRRCIEDQSSTNQNVLQSFIVALQNVLQSSTDKKMHRKPVLYRSNCVAILETVLQSLTDQEALKTRTQPIKIHCSPSLQCFKVRCSPQPIKKHRRPVLSSRSKYTAVFHGSPLLKTVKPRCSPSMPSCETHCRNLPPIVNVH
eukprot:254662-Pelagomonas_calceolata.AAC.2